MVINGSFSMNPPRCSLVFRAPVLIAALVLFLASGLGAQTGELVKESPGTLVPFMAVISVNLAILNLFPIPVLDGGVIIFLLIELIIGRPLNIRMREMAQKIGISLLLILVVIVFYNDILRIFQ